MNHSLIENPVPGTLFPLLPETEQLLFKELQTQWPFTQQQLKLLIDIAKDFSMWQSPSFTQTWQQLIPSPPQPPKKQDAKKAFERIHSLWQDMKKRPHQFSEVTAKHKQVVTERYSFSTIPTDDKILGRCPVASDRTLCCNLLTLDAVRNCGFDCSYCSIQSFFKSDKILVETDLSRKLKEVNLDPNEVYHIGTGQSSDSLMWGNKEGILDDLFTFAEENPNVILEFKTKSKNIQHLLKTPYPKNVISTWSLNPNDVILEEERYTATLEERLHAARKIADKGRLVGFHFHPLLYFEGFKESHAQLVAEIQKRFAPEEVAMISLGTVTFAKSVVKKIRARSIHTKILQMPLQEADGKLSYPDETKLRLFRSVYEPFTPWHNKVFFYLCMENQALWEPIFGFQYENNKEFESAMKDSYLDKINRLGAL
ncbi:MAG: hypothetical protein KDD61_14480 [Bdellovibrionales bacterium]|nr:hypothetical protein [Bdellovibrionales bacterium]